MSTQLEQITDVNGLIIRHGEWAEKNFPGKHDPISGIIEEFGEATHCILKRNQGIRGFDNPIKFRAEYGDALADMAIYILHYCYVYGLSLQLAPKVEGEWSYYCNPVRLASRQRIFCFTLARLILAEEHGKLMEMAQEVQRLYQQVWAMADDEKFVLETVMRETLQTVWNRDWTKNPTDAHTVASFGGQASTTPATYDETDGPETPRHLGDEYETEPA